AGKNVADYTDPQTGIRVISLYGKHERPTREDLKGIDVLVFDIQDVGVRYYTYISSLQYFMEAAFENSIPLILLDRPNPNGFYVDGPVLDPKFRSFVGMQPVPVVYGMTIGEYAFMIAGEKWLSDSANKKFAYFMKAKPTVDTPFHFLVIKCLNYDHTKKYILPVKPSPNLPSIQSIYCYPTTCLFEGTTLSEGRGTKEPFQVFGAPSLPKSLYSFTPEPMPGATRSKHYGEKCYGWKISGTPRQVLAKVDRKIQLRWILRAYKLFPNKSLFFLHNKHFDELAGSDLLKKQIQEGVPESAIRKSWEPALNRFKQIRKKYLLYKDFQTRTTTKGN
ncbi:MAG: DUF1343 domain-containing protein, partial [Bacteroidota bacterium]|nr:DUF1343 domain-containing protein [Bacteroidota bacterium]